MDPGEPGGREASAGRRVPRLSRRMKRHLGSHRKESAANRACLQFAGELLANQLRLVLATTPGTVPHQQALARELRRAFDRTLREVRRRYEALCAAQVHLEEDRGGGEETAAVCELAAATERFVAAFASLAWLPGEARMSPEVGPDLAPASERGE